ncbi:hypothetical protein CDAR_491291 [Caerostris darwini]|uniref:Reverse transcriptase domain-containing protein n=1 Tax=Caerostris darwini TaxID=1538125 RepID=A0AAV4X8X1_9ARAC|nr:hypothetical protein CDAR_491291 [Caerostris darwini]
MGIPQGSCLGPALWNIFINDLLEIDFGNRVKIQAFADDLIIMMMEKATYLFKRTNVPYGHFEDDDSIYQGLESKTGGKAEKTRNSKETKSLKRDIYYQKLFPYSDNNSITNCIISMANGIISKEQHIVEEENDETAFAALMKRQQVLESSPFSEVEFDFDLDSNSDSSSEEE